ncbi:hypothetical protein G6F56_004736 [Rhizopus delemar]|nr:hypothetical protein G6F56_004736 [Rhizopus delemar]
MRSAIASVYRVMHEDKPRLASNRGILNFFAAKRRTDTRPPNFSQEIYEMIKKWGLTETMDLQMLQQKTILLITMATMWRPRSDIGKLQHQDILFVQDDEGKLKGVTLKARAPKEIESKESKLGTIEETNICPVQTLWIFCQKTEALGVKLPKNHTVFLANILGEKNGEPAHSASPVTIANWVKDSLTKAGVDTAIFKAHSLRSASSTKALTNGASLNTVKLHANWSLKSDTLEKYYYKPGNQHERGRILTNSIFETDTEKRTTSDVGVEPTTIVLGTTHNRKLFCTFRKF